MYDDIYALRPDYEIEPGWWKLRWRPLWRKTFAFYRLRSYRAWGFGFFCYDGSARNGWGRSFSCRQIRVQVFNQELCGWIKWNYHVMAEGPLDAEPRRALDLSEVR